MTKEAKGECALTGEAEELSAMQCGGTTWLTLKMTTVVFAQHQNTFNTQHRLSPKAKLRIKLYQKAEVKNTLTVLEKKVLKEISGHNKEERTIS
jgi:hypothetical protein